MGLKLKGKRDLLPLGLQLIKFENQANSSTAGLKLHIQDKSIELCQFSIIFLIYKNHLFYRFKNVQISRL